MLLAACLLAGCGVGIQDVASDVSSPYSDLIHVISPTPGATVLSPVTVTGEARGTWYFEASFPLSVENSKGDILARSPAEAQSDWMTEKFVPFIGRVDVGSYIGDAVLVIRNDNPSGLPENEKELRVPIRIGN